MSASVKLTGFAVILVAVFAVAYVVGTYVPAQW